MYSEIPLCSELSKFDTQSKHIDERKIVVSRAAGSSDLWFQNSINLRSTGN